jgi:curved DNA-binding protein CbpA
MADALPNYYQLLEVPPTAPGAEIRQAYLARLQIYHPDKYPALPAELKTLLADQTKTLNAAYETLSDPVRRREYDADRQSQAQSQAQAQAQISKRAYFAQIETLLAQGNRPAALKAARELHQHYADDPTCRNLYATQLQALGHHRAQQNQRDPALNSFKLAFNIAADPALKQRIQQDLRKTEALAQSAAKPPFNWRQVAIPILALGGVLGSLALLRLS